MVNLTLEKNCTVHCRSLDRSGDNDTSSNFKLHFRDPIKCSRTQYMRAAMISGQFPSSFYQIGDKDRLFTIEFNLATLPFYNRYKASQCPIQPTTKRHEPSTIAQSKSVFPKAIIISRSCWLKSKPNWTTRVQPHTPPKHSARSFVATKLAWVAHWHCRIWWRKQPFSNGITHQTCWCSRRRSTTVRSRI